MNTGQERYAVVNPHEILRTWWPLLLLGALNAALFAPFIFGVSWWATPWIFLGVLAFCGVQYLRPFEIFWGPVVILHDRGITVRQWLGGEWTLAWKDYAGYRDEEGWPWKWMGGGAMGDEKRTLVILSRRHGLYGRVMIRFPWGAGKENYRRLLEALDRRVPSTEA